MDSSETNYPPGDPRLIDKIVYQLKSQGIFDQFRKECMADVDTKPAYQNLHQRVETSVSTFLAGIEWKPDLSKNQLRENLRKHINESGFLEIGVERIVDQVVNPKIRTVFLPHVEEVVYSFLGLERPKQAKPSANSTVLKPINEPPPYTDIKPPEAKKVVTLSDLLPQGLDPVSPESDTSELPSKQDSAMDVDFSDRETILKDKKAEEDISPAFEPLLDENSNGSHISGMSGFSSHDEGHASPARPGAPTVDGVPRLDTAEKMEVETTFKSESESGADKVSSTVEENVQSPARSLTHDMGALDIRESAPSGDRLADAKDEKCDSSMDSMKNENKGKDSDKEKEPRRKEKTDSKSSKSRSDSKDKYKSSDKSKHDSKDKRSERDKLKHEDSKYRSKSETRKEKDSGSKKEKVSDGRKDKSSEVKKDKKVESSKSDHRDGGSKKEKDTGSRRDREQESRRDKDGDKKHDKDGDKKKSSDRDKSRSEDRSSKSKHDDKTKDYKSEIKHDKEGKDKGQNNKGDKMVKSSEKKGQGTPQAKLRTGERVKERSSSTYKHSGDKKSSDDIEKREKDKKAKMSAEHAVHVDDGHSVDADNNQETKAKHKQGRRRTKTPDDMQSTDGDSDARSRDSYKKTSKEGARRLDDQTSTDNESDHKSRDGDKTARMSRHKNSSRQRGSEDQAGDDDGEGSSKDKERKRKGRRHKGGQDDHHMHHSRRDDDRRSADRDSSGSAPQSGGGQAPSQRQGRAGRQESSSSSSPRKSGKTSDTSSSATDAPESLDLHVKVSSVLENQDSEASPTSTLPFKKRPLLQDMESEDNVNNNSYLHDKAAFLESDEPVTKVVPAEDVNYTTSPKQVEKTKLGAVEKSLRSEVNASLADDVPNSDGKPNGTLRAGDGEEENDFLFFKSCDDGLLDDRDSQYVKALAKFTDGDGMFVQSGDEELTVCAVSQCFDAIVKSASKHGIKVVKTVNDIQVHAIQDELHQELGNSFKDLLKNRRYVVRLSDEIKGFRENTIQGKADDGPDKTISEQRCAAEQDINPEPARTNDGPDEQVAYRSTSDEDASGYDAALSSDLILPSLQDLMRESGMVPSPDADSRRGSCRRVGLPRPSTRLSISSGGSSAGACLDKKNGMSSDRRLLRSSVGDSQRYSSEDLYKPRPLFSHGSRRNRHTSEEQAEHTHLWQPLDGDATAGEVQSFGVKRSISEDAGNAPPVAKKRR